MRFPFTIAAVGLLLVSACTPFPENGTGGFAEHRPTLNPNYFWDPVDWAFDPTTEPRFDRYGRRWAVLHDYGWTTYQITRLDCADLRLDGLLAHGAQERFPSHVWRAKRERRIALRTLSAGLEWDGERRLTAYEDSVSELAGRLNVQPEDIRDVDPSQPWRINECSPVSKP